MTSTIQQAIPIPAQHFENVESFEAARREAYASPDEQARREALVNLIKSTQLVDGVTLIDFVAKVANGAEAQPEEAENPSDVRYEIRHDKSGEIEQIMRIIADIEITQLLQKTLFIRNWQKR